VKFVYRDYPLGPHKNAQKAAEAAECAGDQGKFWEMHDILFEKGVKGGVGSFKGFANELGLNSNEFDECLDSGEMAAEVQKDLKDAIDLGIRGTPEFLINEKSISGALPFSNFKEIIDAELEIKR
jgi:protein-disulfide isomerase